MDRRDFTVIENKDAAKPKSEIKKDALQTNPIMKKFNLFRSENVGKFTVKDLFRGVRD